MNLGAYAYCYTMNYFLFDGDSVPYVAVHVMSLHMFLVLAAFVGFIHFFINGFRLEKILHRAQESCLAAADRVANQENDTHWNEIDFPEVPSNAYKVTADGSGYVTRYQFGVIVDMCAKIDICVRYNRQVGEFVAEGTTLAHVWDAKVNPIELDSTEKRKDASEGEHAGNADKQDESDNLDKRVMENITESFESMPKKDRVFWEDPVEEKLGILVNKAVLLSKKRSGDLDMTLGIQQLSDTAMRALSPGINDPQSAIQCMDVLSVVLGRLVDVDLGQPRARDKDGKVRLWAPRRSFAYLLSQLDGIRHYGATDLAVCRRGIRLYGDLGAILTRKRSPDKIPICLTQMEQWLNTARNNFPTNSPELNSIQSLYDSEMENIKVSDHTTVREDESAEGDRQTMEITYDEDPMKSEEGLASKIATALFQKS